jgi:Spy/CpxP family protein refolding chaperone
MKPSLLIGAVMTAGLMLAQTPAPAPPPAAKAHGQMQRLTRNLNLTADQQSQVNQIFRESHKQNKGLTGQLRDSRVALNNAIKSGSEPQIDQITQQSSQLEAQLRANRAKTMAKFYSVLTPDQKAKVDARMARMASGRITKHADKKA